MEFPDVGWKRMVASEETNNCSRNVTQNVLCDTAVEKKQTLVQMTAGAGNTDIKIISRGDTFDKVEDRDIWDKKLDFVLSVIGYAVDLANVWRFPYLCYRNGGGAFLIPYVLFLLVGGMPLLYMELVLGQYHRCGAITVWKICPSFKGTGIAVVIIAFLVALYYNVLIAWSVYYLFSSFTLDLPWLSCGHEWNSPFCYDGDSNGTITFVDGTNVTVNSTNGVSPAEEFYFRKVLGVQHSSGLEDLGGIKWDLCLCLLLVVCVDYFSLWKGVKTSGKVVWITATLPYVVLGILFIRGVTLPGAAKGIKFYLTPDFATLKTSQVWIDAAIQMFYSLGAGFGVHIAFASYNQFRNNCYRDVLRTSIVNSLTSFFAGFVIFSFLGYMSVTQHKPIETVATDGPGLVFVVYPQAISTLPGSSGWAIIFFIMLITLGLDSQFGGFEAVLTGLSDEFPHLFHKRREVLTGAVVITVFLLALPNVTYGGMYLLTIEDAYIGGTSLLVAVFFEAIGVSWMYGTQNFCNDIQDMCGMRPGVCWKILWKFITPTFLLFIVIVSIALYAPLESNYMYKYPPWANSIGMCFAMTSILAIPVTAIYQFLAIPGSIRQRLALVVSPRKEHAHIIASDDVKRFKVQHWFDI
ncbi:sodium-dependent noradrenaline transporter-like [Anneissia japonica]|uniref:sodium-dependent noradrenaline transporter-like n=1 Tax=Anneissia japonica TaxID=1529436 RepID=UPI0014257F91|nr:sodium-dependent noradrenaline transporter-like [Anneissia japonica]XP_033113859.1 sodium-dependent noradrenaline transporter-like [Anneissia japonica]